eukprot:2629986-Rhodomonas_salina.3
MADQYGEAVPSMHPYADLYVRSVGSPGSSIALFSTRERLDGTLSWQDNLRQYRAASRSVPEMA